MWPMGSFYIVFVPLFLTSQFIPDTESVVIQAILDLDNDSEDLIGDLINKVDALIDPKIIDSVNATNELAYALLRIGPLISITGNITHGSQAMSISFSFNAKAGVQEISSDSDDENESEEESDWGLLGLLGETVRTAELCSMFAISVVVNSVVSIVVTNLMTETALLTGPGV
ncbi:Hypothetical protein NTJ_09451 [Nesidiocoris tenuis]|uniref:CNNM transmembrane domain-containing protein n=1 Tax=Nesidiocoris tenuis TaxID=355587 RepID=A0ABN7AWS2_9HEMI|nr:Hypothetical protein NTJ_09451 [Nesidiocoris tenuis]